VVMLGFVAFWRLTNRERAALEEHWRGYAARRGLEYLEAAGDWPNRSSPAVEWTRGAVRFRLGSLGKEARARTRLVAWPRAKLLGALAIGTSPGGTDGTGDLGIDDKFFTDAFRVREQPRGFAARVLDRPARVALLSFRQGDDVSLVYRRGRLVLEWPGREWNDARIDEAERVLADLVRAVEDAFHGRQEKASGPEAPLTMRLQ
jgi:hypothetical protein